MSINISAMQTSLLIVGKTASARREKAQQIAAESSSKFDTLILDASEESGIEDVRNFLARSGSKPFDSQLTSTLILEAQNLTIEAQNLLLKTLEEPAESQQWILTAPSNYSLLTTINSRCRKINLGQEIVTEEDFEKKTLTLSEKIDLAENLDIEKWERLWRQEMLKNISKGNLPSIVRYLHKIAKTKEFLAKRASPKIAKINLLLDTPEAV